MVCVAAASSTQGPLLAELDISDVNPALLDEYMRLQEKECTLELELKAIDEVVRKMHPEAVIARAIQFSDRFVHNERIPLERRLLQNRLKMIANNLLREIDLESGQYWVQKELLLTSVLICAVEEKIKCDGTHNWVDDNENPNSRRNFSEVRNHQDAKEVCYLKNVQLLTRNVMPDVFLKNLTDNCKRTLEKSKDKYGWHI